MVLVRVVVFCTCNWFCIDLEYLDQEELASAPMSSPGRVFYSHFEPCSQNETWIRFFRGYTSFDLV